MQRSLTLASLTVLAALGSATRPAAAQTHFYDLTQGYADAYGGPALTPNGGTRTAAGYAFGVDQGPTLNGALSNLASYRIELVFSLDANRSQRDTFQKLIDFQGLTRDGGLYDDAGTLQFYSIAGGSSQVFVSGQTADVVLSRDGNTGLVTGSVNGVRQFQVADIGSDAVFTADSIRFFQDDSETGGQEAGSGLLKSVRISPPLGTPEPSPIAVFGLGVFGLSLPILRAYRARRRTV